MTLFAFWNTLENVWENYWITLKCFVNLISARQAEFKAEALKAKKQNDKYMALGFLKVAKQFDTVVEAHYAGHEMDLNELPTVELITASLEHDRYQQQTDVVQRSVGSWINKPFLSGRIDTFLFISPSSSIRDQYVEKRPVFK